MCRVENAEVLASVHARMANAMRFVAIGEVNRQRSQCLATALADFGGGKVPLCEMLRGDSVHTLLLLLGCCGM